MADLVQEACLDRRVVLADSVLMADSDLKVDSVLVEDSGLTVDSVLMADSHLTVDSVLMADSHLTVDLVPMAVQIREASLANPRKTETQHRVAVKKEFPMPDQQTSHFRTQHFN